MIDKIKQSIHISPLFSAFSADLIFFVPIDTLYLTLVKRLSASEIALLTTFSLIFCIIFQKGILYISKKIGNVNSSRLGAFLLFIASIILTFGTSFVSMVVYRTIFELALMFLNMASILLKNNLNSIDQADDYYKIRNESKILYAVVTMITALSSGFLFNLDPYLPMYLSIMICFFNFVISFLFYEDKTLIIKENIEEENSKKEFNFGSTIFLVLISNAIFFSLVKLGQSNGKLFIQYDFQNYLSTEMVTYYLTIIVFLSRIARVLGNIIFGKLYLKFKEKICLILSSIFCISFILLIVGYFIKDNFTLKMIIMSIGFFLTLASRDTFHVYIENTALDITDEELHQKVMMDIEVYRKISTLILSMLISMILFDYDMLAVIILMLIIAIIELIINVLLSKRFKIKYDKLFIFK